MSYALTSIQEGMVFHHFSEQDKGIDVEQILIDFPETPDIALFAKAWQSVVDTHEALRLRLGNEGDTYRLVAVPAFVIPVSDVSEAVARLGWTAWLSEDRDKGFALEKQVPMRVAHAPLNDGTRVVWTLHHILLDGRSFPAVLVDVFDAFESLLCAHSPAVKGRPDRLEHLQWLASLDPELSRDYWTERLEGFAGSTTLVETARPGSGWDAAEIELEADETRALRAECAASGTSLNVLVQGAWAILLSRYTDNDDVCFGAVRAGRKGSPASGTDAMLGVFITTVPTRVQLAGMTVRSLLAGIAEFHRSVRPHEHTPLTFIQNACAQANAGLFDTIVVFDYASLNQALHRLRPQLNRIRFSLRERPPYAVTLYAYADANLLLRLSHRLDALSPAQARAALERLRQLLKTMATQPDLPVDQIGFLTPGDRQRLAQFNATERVVPFVDVGTSFMGQVERHPDRIALKNHQKSLSYGELGDLVRRLTANLSLHGVKAGTLVGINLDRSFEMVASVLAVLRLGAAYLPLDPTYPSERLQHYVRDSGAAFIITSHAQHRHFRGNPALTLDIATLLANPTATGSVSAPPGPSDLAYIIYTSGSTGTPNGVMIEHRSLGNFLAAMDALLEPAQGGRWLAVTSLSFDISVLELLWTLTRGFEVVLHGSRQLQPRPRRVGFSLFHFAQGADGDNENPYRLILEAARFGDRAGFQAVWSPERHFHEFGAPYPNPSVISAAIAASTSRIGIRAGSIVLPLHDPLRVAEEWAIVDRISEGRVGLAIATGWQPNDFALAPEKYTNRKQVTLESIEVLRKLWRGEAITRKNGVGHEVSLRTFPQPAQTVIPLWITAAGNPETFQQAGRLGANVLTHMLGQSVEQLRSNIDAYRRARQECGFDEGSVTVMLHTFVGEDDESVKALTREPLKAYLASSASLVGQYADTWTAYRRGSSSRVEAADIAAMDEETRNDMYEFAFERFFATSSLLGSEDKCAALIEALLEIGVNEIACLIDFGIATDLVLQHLPYIQRLSERVNGSTTEDNAPSSLIEELKAFQPTHLQCTPTQARMLTLSSDNPEHFASLQHFLVGGEALPTDLARDLRQRLAPDARLSNMYGPTETTVWSTTSEIPADFREVAIGTPILNTRCHILDTRGRHVPIGQTGELFIAGEGLARGYHNRPQLNASRFATRSTLSGEQERMYATGDLVRLGEDGALRYLGRRDFQFKVRGYRIELGEIEAALRKTPGIEHAAVAAHTDDTGTRQLAAYVVCRANSQLDANATRAFLRTQLPEYMVPPLLFQLESLPLTPNGKVDRKALPIPKPAGPEAAQADAARDTMKPASPPHERSAETIEAIVQETWQQLLGIAKIDRQDNFFELGGHSILAVRVQGELGRKLGRKVAIADIFRFPTIAALAQRLSGSSQAAP